MPDKLKKCNENGGKGVQMQAEKINDGYLKQMKDGPKERKKTLKEGKGNNGMGEFSEVDRKDDTNH